MCVVTCRGAGRTGLWASKLVGARHCVCDTALGRLGHDQLGPMTRHWAGHDTATRERPMRAGWARLGAWFT